MTITAVLFDMGFTLTKHDFSHPGEIFQRILTSLGIYKSLDDVKKAFLNAENEAKELDLFSSYGRMMWKLTIRELRMRVYMHC